MSPSSGNIAATSAATTTSLVYATLNEVKDRLLIDHADTTWDTILESVIEAVSRWIDSPEGAGRRFYTTTTDETRYFTADSEGVCYIDDLVSFTSLATDEDNDGTFEYTWAAADYVLRPRTLNPALQKNVYTSIRRTTGGAYYFPTTEDGVKVVGRFGYCDISCNNAPKAVVEACILQSMRVFRRKDSVQGFVSGMDIGQAMQIGEVDFDVRTLLDTVSAGEERIYVGG